MTGAIIVLYHPDLPQLDQALSALLPQVDEVCLVDNSDESHAEHFEGRTAINYIPLMRNFGLAHAQNLGVSHFRERGFDDVLFCDQDSTGTPLLVSGLKAVRHALEQQGHRVAAIGPLPINQKTGKSYYNKPGNVISRLTVATATTGNSAATYHVEMVHSVISSFSLVRLSAINEVGPFEERLFIDAVDNEWGWRAESFCGMHSFVAGDLTFSHMQGQATRLPVKKSAPMRLYYQYRNFLVMLRRHYVPSFWKWHCAWTYLLKLGFYPLFVSPRLDNLRQMMRGIRDGILHAWPHEPSSLLAAEQAGEDSVSILMAVYAKDNPAYFDEAMRSIWTDQTRRPDQIVLIEDGPLPVGLQRVVEKWKKEIGQPLEVYANEQNRGLTHSLNVGLSKTTGHFIARMDSDDLSHPERLERQLNYMLAHPEIDILGGTMQEFDAENPCLNVRHYPATPEAARSTMHKASPVAHPTVMMRRRMFAEGLRYDERYPISQDIALWFDAVGRGWQISNIPQTTLYFRRADDVYKRRGRVKAWNEFRIYMRGIRRLHGLLTPKYVYPVMRLAFRLMPQFIVRWGYDSPLRRRIAEKKD